MPIKISDMADARAHYRACRSLCDAGQLDAEPRQTGRHDDVSIMAHWSPSLLQPWLDADATLENAGIATVDQLYAHSYEKILRTKNIGRVMLGQIRDLLESRGLALVGDPVRASVQR